MPIYLGMNAKGIERCEIMGDWYDEIREEDAKAAEDAAVDAHYQDWLARQPIEITKNCTRRGMYDWVLSIHWKNGKGESFSEYFETEREWNARHEELQGMRNWAYHPPL